MEGYTIAMMGWLLIPMNQYTHLATLPEEHLHLLTGTSMKELLLLELVVLLVLGISCFPSIFIFQLLSAYLGCVPKILDSTHQ